MGLSCQPGLNHSTNTETVVQKSCRVSICENTQNQTGHGPGQPAVACSAWARGMDLLISEGPFLPLMILTVAEAQGRLFSSVSFQRPQRNSRVYFISAVLTNTGCCKIQDVFFIYNWVPRYREFFTLLPTLLWIHGNMAWGGFCFVGF